MFSQRQDTYRVVGVLPDGSYVTLLCWQTLEKAQAIQRQMAMTSKLVAVEIELEKASDYPACPHSKTA